MMWRRQTFAITRLFLRRFAFHPMVLACIFVMPLVIALIFGTADERALSRMPVGVLQTGDARVDAQLVDALDAEPGIDIRSYSSYDDLVRSVRRADVAGGVVTGPDGAVMVYGDTRDPIYVSARAVIHSVAARGGVVVDTDPQQVQVSELATTDRARATGRPRAAAGMLVFWVVVNGCFMATFLTEDRARGVLYRTAAGPVRASAIVTGEVLGRVLLTFIQGVLIVAITSVVLGATWGALLPLTLVLIALAMVSAGLSVLLGLVIGPPGPEAAIQVIAVAAVCGLLGGCFWTLAFVPSAMRTLAYVTPHAWALRAIENMAARGAGVGGVSLELAVLAGFAISFLAIATFGLRRATLTVEGSK